MIKSLYHALKENEFDAQGRCKCCIGDKWVGHASYCKVGMGIAEYENQCTKTQKGGAKVNEICINEIHIRVVS